MCESYWQLDRKPFENNSDPNFYYPCESHQGALLKLRYSIENDRGGALLAGASGLGKTLLVHLLRRQLPDDYSPFVHLVFPQMAPAELLAYLADELGAPVIEPGRTTIDGSVRRLRTFLSQNTREGRHAVVAIDEAHLLEGPRVFETLRLLLNFETDSHPDLNLLLIGQPSLLPVLERMPQFDERLGVKCLLRPMTLEETISYVSHRLTAARAPRGIFDGASLEAIHHLTQGNPRRVNRLCDLALLIGFADELSTIGAGQLETISQELVAVNPD